MNRKVRSILTISGVVIGICAITFLTSLGYGFQRMTTEKVSSKDTLYVFDINLENSDKTEITEKDLAMVKNAENIEVAEPGLTLPGKASNGKANTNIVVNGANNKFLELGDVRLLRGQKYSDTDTNQAIVTTNFLKAFGLDLNNYQDANIRIDILASHAMSPTLTDGDLKSIENVKIKGIIDDDQTSYVYLPYELVKKASAAENSNVGKIKVTNYSNGKLKANEEKVMAMGFGTNYIGDTIEQINSFFNIFRYIIAGFGFVAMLVAVLGMFNTLTVSLLERTREVGVLKSSGAVKGDIWKIFLFEALAISFVGGVMGIIFGMGLGQLTSVIFNYYAQKNGSEAVNFFYTPPMFIVYTIGVTILVGFFTGYYPSMRAAKINALDALKYE